MAKLVELILVILHVTTLSEALPNFPVFSESGSVTLSSLYGRDTDPSDPEDLSFIKSLAAVGDSYSAGIGAGKRLGTLLGALDPHGDWACSRYDNAYPYLINEDDRLGDKSKRKFQFEACSGAVIEDVITSQIPRISSGQQVILLSAGGNDAELVNILNQCIFQWGVITQTQVKVAKAAALDKNFAWAEDFDWDALGRGCEGQLKHTSSIINSKNFSNDLDKLLSATKKKLAKDGMIYLTGYGKFFAESMTTECDEVSWTTWIYKTYNVFQKSQKLTVAHRKTMNQLVDAINSKLADAAHRAGPSVKFVNYDHYIGDFAGRMCEKGVDESTTESNSRPDLMFYELNTWDPLGNTPWKRTNDGPLNGTFNGQQEIYSQITLLVDPHAEFSQQKGNTTEDKTTPENKVQGVVALETGEVQVPNILPDGYGRVFHPQMALHQMIANLVIYEMVAKQQTDHKLPDIPEKFTLTSCPIDSDTSVLKYKHTKPGNAVKPGTELRILGVGDSITVGFLSDQDGGDGNGYRLKLQKDLSKDKVVFAGTESAGSMGGNRFAAWSGKTIKYISDHVEPSLDQRPNIILLHAGTNDMSPNPDIATEGDDPHKAADRLGQLIDRMVKKCPDATILVAKILNTCEDEQETATKVFQSLIPDLVKKRRDAGHHVIAVDFTTFSTKSLRDCIHPTNQGYADFGDYWYDFIGQIPKDWIEKPVGKDPPSTEGGGGSGKIEDNGGLDKHIPAPDWGKSPIRRTSRDFISKAIDRTKKNPKKECRYKPVYAETGQIALGAGRVGDWKFKKNWHSAGKVFDGHHLDPRHVRLHDMNGDGKADYVWVDPKSGAIWCWLNNLPKPWTPAGSNKGLIAAGVAPADRVFIADMNGDGKEDYMVVNPDKGSVKIWWNQGPDPKWANGWKFNEGSQIASGVPHANLETLRFPDINGDGRADYVYIGEGGSLRHFLNTGSAISQSVVFLDQHGIATGATKNISKLIFADMNGDGRDDYLIWDDKGGLTGFLNQPTFKEGVPVFINQGPAKTIADGIGKDPSSIRLADLDGDGKDDYVYIDDQGGISVWYNHGTADAYQISDYLHFADMTGNKVDDYIWVEPDTGSPVIYLNKGLSKKKDHDPLGWAWSPHNDGKPIESLKGPAALIHFADLNGDGKADYVIVDPDTGDLTAAINKGPKKSEPYKWRFEEITFITSGLGPGRNVRLADVDGDGRVDYIYLNDVGGATVLRNVYNKPIKGSLFTPMDGAKTYTINRRPEEISFHDINHDGKADYVLTDAIDGSVRVLINNYPDLRTWVGEGQIAEGVHISGSNVKWARLTKKGHVDYVAVDPTNGAIGAWLNICDSKSGKKYWGYGGSL